MKKVLISIPVYNEEKNIAAVIDELRLVCPKYDILIVDDCSTDNSKQVCKNIDGITVISLANNLGIGGARQTAFRYAYHNNYDAMVQLDGDGQHDPNYIDAMLSALSNHNMCIGSRFINFEGFQSTLTRRMGISYLNRLIKVTTGLNVTDPTSGFRVCDKKTIKLFALDYPVDYPEPESIVSAAKNNLTVCEMPVKMKERQNGKSSIGKFDSLYFMFKVSVAILIDSLFLRNIYAMFFMNNHYFFNERVHLGWQGKGKRL